MQDDILAIHTVPRIPLGDVTLDLAGGRLISREGRLVELRPQAYAVLRHLAVNAGRVVTKEELFAAVWPGVVVTDDSLVQAIGDIRRALGARAHQIIRTVPRRGYCLSPEPGSEPETALSDVALPATRAEPPSSSGPAMALSDVALPAPRAEAPSLSGPATALSDVAVPAARAEPPSSSGFTPSTAARAEHGLSDPRRRAVAWAGLAIATAALPAIWVWRVRQASPSASSPGFASAPTIAVPPFDSVALDGSRTWIGDGLSISIASALARLSGLPVLWTRTPVGAKAGGVEAMAGNGAERATHLLSGSIRSDDQRVRATVQLTEVVSGRVLWSERFEAPMSSLFALEDEVTAKTVSALRVTLVEGEQARSRTHPRGNLRAWELATLGYMRFEESGRVPLAKARELFEQALALDPEYAWARSFLAATCFLEARFGFAPEPAASLQRAFDEASRAVRTDPGLPDAHSTLGSILLARRQFDEALAEGRRAIALGPNDAEIHAVLAQTMLAVGEWAEAVALSQKAVRLSALPPSWYFVPLSFSLVFLGRPAEAIAAAEQMLRRAESPFQQRAALLAIVFAHVEAGRMEAARLTVAKLLALPSGASAARAAANLLFKDARHQQRLTEALRSAGVPG